MNGYPEWAARHPAAAAELKVLLGAIPWPATEETDGKSEMWAQQHARMDIAKQGAMAWRNNVGATPSKCPDCGAKQRVIRYGAANDSTKLNKEIKSGDLILAIPRRITRADVNTTIAQFGTVETKPPGWKYSGSDREVAQLAWLTLICRLGGFATFSTGEVTL